MSKDESVVEYNERVLEIANGSFNLGEKISESKIVRKMLLSLPGKIDMKVTAIEEAHDITKLKLDELFGSLLTFEMTISNRENKKDTDDSEEDDGGTNAFIVNITETDSVTEDESENSKEESDNELSFKQLKIQWKKDSKVRAIQNEKIQGLLDENERLLIWKFRLNTEFRTVQFQQIWSWH
ncbi:gag-pol polyprotein [Cucumis melo var. makuwa]|uniref:Gag-pol polyprotein n=1 Tax=Cucumis melo var. makuwa TaxID=1194695 RepID=A0A5D3DEU3_CUCMM|nr:gag-pol polyprotein [Cucumis melo var. makuwa]